MQVPSVNMLVLEMEIVGKTYGYYRIKIAYGNKNALIAFSPDRRNLVFIDTGQLNDVLEQNEYQIRKLLHNKRKSTFYIGFKLKFALRNNKKVQEFNDPDKIIVLDRRNGNYLSYTLDYGDSDVYKIFTDGCYLQEKRSGGFVALTYGEKGFYKLYWGRLDGESNSTLLELLAAIEGLKHLPEGVEKVRIVTDSRYVIKGLTEWVINWKLNDWYTIQGRKVRNIEYWKEFDKLTQGKYVEFQWIKSHSFHFENTICDHYAREAATKNIKRNPKKVKL